MADDRGTLYGMARSGSLVAIGCPPTSAGAANASTPSTPSTPTTCPARQRAAGAQEQRQAGQGRVQALPGDAAGQHRVYAHAVQAEFGASDFVRPMTAHSLAA